MCNLDCIFYIYDRFSCRDSIPMTIVENTEELVFDKTGGRLNHILDQIGFREGRGRVSDLQKYLIRTRPEYFANLKYTTVRSWLLESAPPMKKIEVIMDALQDNYEFKHDISQIKNWWKLGGFYPFTKSSQTTDIPLDDRSTDIDFSETLKKVDSIYLAQIHILIYNTAAELNINLITDLTQNVMSHIFSKVVTYCKAENPEIDSPELKDLIVSILRLAKEGLL